jgi:hypothetical protein
MGIPKKVHLWCDLEGKAATQAGVKGCMSYVSGWAYEVRKVGYQAGLYLSQSLPNRLSTADLHNLVNGTYLTQELLIRGAVPYNLASYMPLVTCFWKAANTIPALPFGSFSIKQSGQQYHYWRCHSYWDTAAKKVREKCLYDIKDVDWKIVIPYKGKLKRAPKIKFAYDPDKIFPSKAGTPYVWGA